MADDADRAETRIQQAIDDGISRASRQTAMVPVGVCYWCESPVSPARVFCSVECRDDFEHDSRRRKETGL